MAPRIMPPGTPSLVNRAPTPMPAAITAATISGESNTGAARLTAPPPCSQTITNGSSVTRNTTRDICTTATLAASAPIVIDTDTI